MKKIIDELGVDQTAFDELGPDHAEKAVGRCEREGCLPNWWITLPCLCFIRNTSSRKETHSRGSP